MGGSFNNSRAMTYAHLKKKEPVPTNDGLREKKTKKKISSLWEEDRLKRGAWKEKGSRAGSRSLAGKEPLLKHCELQKINNNNTRERKRKNLPIKRRAAQRPRRNTIFVPENVETNGDEILRVRQKEPQR